MNDLRELMKGEVTPRDWTAVVGIVGATMLIAALFYFFVNQSQKNRLAQIEVDDRQVSKDLQQAQEIQRKIEDLEKETEKIKLLVEEFEERLPSSREIPTLLKEFERMAALANVDVELSPMTRNRDTRKETIPYSIVARGSFHQVTEFINRLERFKRYLKISNLSFSPVEEGITTSKFTLNTYRFIKAEQEGTS